MKIKGHHKFILLPFASAIWQRAPFGDISIGHPFPIHYTQGYAWHSMVIYSKLGAEFNFNFQHGLWAPKFSSEIDYKYFCFRINVEDYITSGNTIYATPEFGLTLSGFISLTGGYNKALLENQGEIIPPFRITLSLLIPVILSGGSENKNHLTPQQKAKEQLN